MTPVPPSTVFVICGPTASGKSGLALALAERLGKTETGGTGGTVINADSMQVYRGLEILTAQPDAQTRARVPHELYGVLAADDPCSAGRWRGMALEAIATAQAEGRVPILTGGTGLYLKALMEGIAPVPKIPDGIRADVRARHARLGNDGLHAALAVVDPDAAATIKPSDPQRMMRALEVMEATGEPLKAWQGRQGTGAPAGLDFRTVLLDPPRADLYAAIEVRFDAMVAAGAVDEAAVLVGRGLDPSLPAMKALGVADLARAAAGGIALEDAVMQAKTASRHYAKRQVTWFKGQIITNFRYNEKFSESFCQKILSDIL
ncbi:MAG: tRNA dimethylallyltransferase [Alphaproteobacteria bacterium]|jgi:tRNA dimethylallyltransferase